MIDQRVKKITSLSLAEFDRPETLALVQKIAEETRDTREVGDAQVVRTRVLAYIHEKSGDTQSLSLVRRYQEIVAQLTWIALPALPLEDVAGAFAAGLVKVSALDDEYVREQMKNMFRLVTPDEDLFNRWRTRLVQALRTNEEALGSGQITISETQEILPAQLRYWIKDYDQSRRFEGRAGAVQLVEYMNGSRNVGRLSAAEKVTLRSLLELYDFLRFGGVTSSSLSTTGHALPDKIDSSATVNSPTRSTSASVPNVEQRILTALAGQPTREQKILAGRQQLASRSLNTATLRAEFFKAVQQKNIELSIACLQLMIERNEVGALLRQDEKLRTFLAALWDQRIGKSAGQEFIAAPDAPKQVRRFIRYVLQERLGMPEAEAALQGVRLGQWFVRSGQNQYTKIAYYDLPAATFRWFGDNE
jgi:hypothetical protein